jgi:peptidoglycan-associated lipoprotein
MNPKKRTAAALILLVAAVLFTAACKKKVAAPPPPPPPPPPSPTVTLSAAPSTIDRGQSARLTWSSENATKMDLQPGIGSVDAQGSRQVSPNDSTTYTLTVTGPGGSDSATARVTVVVPPPPPPPPPPREISEVELFGQSIKHAYFDFDRYNIRSDAGEALSQNADFLRNRPGLRFAVEGHCDERGSEEYNLGLGDRRANSAKEYLINLGISEGRIRAISYGKSRPACTESNEECWQENRRAHMRYGQ